MVRKELSPAPFFSSLSMFSTNEARSPQNSTSQKIKEKQTASKNQTKTKVQTENKAKNSTWLGNLIGNLKNQNALLALMNLQNLKKEFKEIISHVFWFLRITCFLAIACNTPFVGLGIFLIPFFIFETSTAIYFLSFVVILYLPTYLGDPATTGSRKWKLFSHSFIIKDLIKWFQGDIVKTVDLPSGNKYIFAVAPHGVVPLSCLWMLLHEKWNEYFPSVEAVALGSSVFHYAPIIRDIAMWCGTREVTKSSFLRVFKEGKSVVMIPGGISELKLSKSTSKTIKLYGKHTGFIKIAIQQGVPLVPVYSFGETLTFDHLDVPIISWALYKFLKMPFPYFPGALGFLQIPRRKPISVVVGEPILIEKDENPSVEKIQQVKKQYYDQLKIIFEKNKHNHGHSDYQLQVLHLDD